MLYLEPFDVRQVNDLLFENEYKDFTMNIFPGVY
jgi:hypothetical protein